MKYVNLLATLAVMSLLMIQHDADGELLINSFKGVGIAALITFFSFAVQVGGILAEMEMNALQND